MCSPFGRRFTARRTIATVIFLSIAFLILQNFNKDNPYFTIELSENDFLHLSKCPACYGTDFCPHMNKDNLHLHLWSKCKICNYFNAKNVYYGTLGDNHQEVVLKMLAHNWELDEADAKICQEAAADSQRACDVKDAIIKLQKITNENNHGTVNASMLHNLSHIFKCPSQRLLRHLQAASNKRESLMATAHFITTAIINQEGVLLQAFPAEEWPFPQYLGACGRMIVEEYVGRTLEYYSNADWMFRLHLAYQLMEIAQLLTKNSAEFAFYLTDVSFHNFAVRKNGSVVLIDVEDVIVVDQQDVRKRQPAGWDQPHQHTFDGCADCLSFSSEDLCDHEIADHNYYAICQSLLVQNSYSHGIKGGLLHGMPWRINEKWNLEKLLEECAKPSSKLSRFDIVPELMKTMKAILQDEKTKK